MGTRSPVTRLGTHVVENQPPPLEGYNLYESDPALREALHREGGAWGEQRLRALGGVLGDEGTLRLADQANRHVPELVSFDRFGHRIDEIEYHPAYHELLGLSIRHEVPSIAWTERRAGGHTVHTALSYLVAQTESGICCPATMTYAAIPTLREQPEVAAEWEPGVLSNDYDPRSIPAKEKSGLTMGMAMTEKQGGSDVRTNTTRARPLGRGGPGEEYELTGHKWFCSAPMSDAFLALAYTEKEALSCFLVPRWKPDGTRNPLLIQRLKDKLGDRSNASSEIEYDRTWARMVGEEGRGVRTIIEMVHHTRLDTVSAAAALMRQAVRQAVHHADHRRAFGRLLADQPLMQNVLADLAVEAEASVVLAMRLARAFDEGQEDESSRVFARIATAVAKYWVNKRVTGQVCEALECHGGGGYVEESIMARLFREAPLNSIWEGSGNVICLDVLRAMHREPESVAAFLGEIELARGGNRHLDRAIDGLREAISEGAEQEARARWLTERMALALEGSLLVRHAPGVVADAFCTSRLATDTSLGYGTLPAGTDFGPLIERARAGVG